MSLIVFSQLWDSGSESLVSLLVQEGNITSQQEQWLQSGHEVLTVFLCTVITSHSNPINQITGSSFGMPTVLGKLHKGQVCQWPASDTQRSRSSCLSVTQNATRNKESSCLGHWESDTQHVPGFWSLFSTPQRRSAQLPDHRHTMDTRTCFLQDPYPLMKYPHSSKNTSSLPSDENLPFQTAKSLKGTWFPFPKCRHSTLLVMEKTRDSG